MIETTQTVLVNASIEAAWAYARDIERWAEIMPGYQSCTIESDDDSRWVLKVGVGGLVRTVKVKVHVDTWAGPGRVDFTYNVEGDPVQGGGTYLATHQGSQTEIALTVQVRGSGPMAPMWEAMGGPLLPRFAREFAEQLKAGIETAAPAGEAASAEPVSSPPPLSLLTRLMAWLRTLFGGKQRRGMS